MKTREEALTYGMSFPDTYREAPFHDPNWQLVRVKKSKKAFLWTYEKDGYYVTHRIIKKNKNKVITKGDANNVADEEIKVSSIVGKVIYHGGILNFLIKFKYFIVCGLLGLYLLSTFFNKKIKEQE